jgi:uncharacterized protein (TIGR02300 family)
VAKTELGTKRICPVTGRKFYDLGKSPVISPYTGEVVPIVVAPQSRSRPADARAAAAAATPAAEEVLPETADAEFVSLEDAEAESTGGKKVPGDAVDGDDDVEIDETLDDAAFIEETEEEDADVTDIIGDVADDEET